MPHPHRARQLRRLKLTAKVRRTDDQAEGRASLSHDLAQPLTSAASLAELLAADWPTLTESDRRDLATKIDNNLRRIVDIIREPGDAEQGSREGQLDSDTGRR